MVDVVVAQTTVQLPTSSNSSWNITTSDLGGKTPKGCLVLFSAASSANTAEAGAVYCIGMSDGTNTYTSTNVMEDGQSRTDTYSRIAGTNLLELPTGRNANTNDTTLSVGTGFITNGINVNFSRASSDYDGCYVTFVFFAGTDVSAFVGNYQGPGTTSPSTENPGGSYNFQTDLLIQASQWDTGTGLQTGSNPQSSIGFCGYDGSSYTQYNSVMRASDNSSDGDDYAVVSPDAIAVQSSNTNLSYQRTITAFGSSGGFTYTLDLNSGSSDNFATIYLALKLGGQKVNVSLVNSPSSTGSNNYTGPNFQPMWMMSVGTYLTAENSVASADPATGLQATHSACVSGASVIEATHSAMDLDGSATSDTASWYSSTFRFPRPDQSESSTTSFSMATTFISTGWNWNVTNRDSGTTRKFIVMVVEATATAQNLSLNYLSAGTSLYTPTLSPGSVSRTLDYISPTSIVRSPFLYGISCVSDDFSGTLEGYWWQNSYNWDILSGELRSGLSGSNTPNIWAQNGATETVDQWAKVKLVDIPATDYAGLAFRGKYLSGGNGGIYTIIATEQSGGAIVITYTSNNTYQSTLKSWTSTGIADGDTLGAAVYDVAGNQQFDIWINPVGADPNSWGTPDYTWTETTTHVTTGYLVGLSVFSSVDNVATFDDFACCDYVPTSAQNISLDYLSSATALYEPTLAPGAVSREVDYISAGTALYEPTLTSSYAISLDYITATTALYEPSFALSYNLSLDYVSPAAALYEPTLAATYALTLDYISATTALYDPTLLRVFAIALDYISDTAIYELTAAPGAIAFELDYIASTAALYEPTLQPGAATAGLDYIAAATTLYEPTLQAGAVTASIDFISSSVALYEPELLPGSVARTLSFISDTATYELSLTSSYALTVDYITSTVALYEPTLAPGSVTLSLDYLAATTALYDPFVTAGATLLSLDYLSPTTTLYDPTLSPGAVTLSLDYLSPATALYEPSFALTYALSLDYITAVTALYDPTVYNAAGASQNLPLDYLSPATALYEPSFALSYNLSLDYITSTTALYEPSFTGTLAREIDYISATTALYDPTVISSYNLSLDYIAESQVFELTAAAGAVALSLDYLSSTTALYDPLLSAGASLIAADYISSTAVYELDVAPGQAAVSLDYISSSTQLFEPTMATTVALSLDYISETSVYEATLTSSYTTTIDYISAGTTLYTPTIVPGAITAILDYISETSIYELDVMQAGYVYVDYISSTALYEPNVGSTTLSLDFITAGTILYTPSVTRKALRRRDTGRYVPGVVPENVDILPSVVRDELRRIAIALDALATSALTLEVLYKEPTKILPGMLVRADGNGWNPGSGKGLYVYQDGAWQFII